MALIPGVLKKEESKQEVPDELPALGEDIAPPPEIKQPEAPKVIDDGDLPLLEPERKPDVIAEETGEREEIPMPQQEPKGEGFFNNVSKLLDSGAGDKLLYQDLLANMKQSWSIKKESDKSGLSSSEEKNIKANVSDVLSQLRLMESKWKAHKLVLEEDQKVLLEHEEKIKEKEKELKKLIRQFKVYQHVPNDQAVLLKNSIPITSISELINALRNMTASEFTAHVRKSQNDFSSLASAVDAGLGRRIKSCASKEEMLRYLEAFVSSTK
jgi:hypothetical protein